MSEQLPLGKLVTDAKYHPDYRDAVHVAVVPVTADEPLSPGYRVGLKPGDPTRASPWAAPVGIVDPFLTASVLSGQRFWLFLFPASIGSLRHHWQHPAFPEDAPAAPAPTPDRAASVAWLTEFGKDFDMGYEDLVRAAREHRTTGGCYTLDFSTPDKVFDDGVMDLFWLHYQVATGERGGAGNFFTCSC